MAEEVLPLCAQLLRDGGFVAHSHFVHDLEVVLILVPGPLQGERKVRTENDLHVVFTSVFGGGYFSEVKRKRKMNQPQYWQEHCL